MRAADSVAEPAVGLLDYVLLLVLATLWAMTYGFVRVAVETIPPLTLITVRSIIACAILYGLMAAKGVPLPRDADNWRKFIFQATLNTAVPFLMVAWAEETVNAGLATILNSTVPIFAFLINWGITRGESPTLVKLLGVISGITGVALIVGYQALQGLGQDLVAQLLLVGSAICYAGAAIYGRNFQGLHDLVPATGSLIAAIVVLAPIAVVVDRPWMLHPSVASIIAMFGLAILTTALGLILYFRLIRRMGSIAVTAQGYLRVPIGVMIGVVFLGETLAPTAWIGLVCVVLGVAAMTVPARSRA